MIKSVDFILYKFPLGLPQNGLDQLGFAYYGFADNRFWFFPYPFLTLLIVFSSSEYFAKLSIFFDCFPI